MRELLVATHNKKKLEEIKDLLQNFPLKITSLQDYPDIPPVEEDGITFKSNALKKAQAAAFYTKKLTLGEDSGLEVKILRNQPGVYSARFSGEGATDEENNRKLLKMLEGVPAKQRQARYRSVAVLVIPGKTIAVATGSCQGLIGLTPKGKNGFGYDPLFLIPRFQKTFGELPPKIKSTMSHRSRALNKLKGIIQRYLA